jgi:hypothetical protein
MLDAYPDVIAAQGSDKLVNLDRWYHEELPPLLQERQQQNAPCLHLDEIQGIAAWKMSRGVWRERNRQLIATNDPQQVVDLSRKAFEAVPDPREPVALLSKLAGVGPATASAALAAYAPTTYPFFDELVANSIPGLGPVAFTLKYYLAYAGALRERTARLSTACTHRAWTAHEVSQALWAETGGKGAAT